MAAAAAGLQVTAEFKKANGLIKPGPKTIKVWAALYAEIEKVRSSCTCSGRGEGEIILLPCGFSRHST
jgi:hypothetical protein